MNAPGEDHPKPFPLAMAREGERVRIARLNGGHGLDMRLTEMGLNVGSEVVVAHRQSGQLVVVRGQARLALGAGIARKIMVLRLEDGARE